MSRLDLAKAAVIVEVALRHARSEGMKPMTVAVLDAGGHLVAFQRQDNAGILRPQIAFGKAWGSLGMGMGGRDLAKRAEHHPQFFSALSVASEGRIFPVAGGVLVRDHEGAVLGAVGISGDLPPNDEACGIAGITSAGLVADAGTA